MNKIKIEIFGKEAELLSFESDSSDGLAISFTEKYDGFISIDGVTQRVAGGEAVFDLRLISAGEFAPILILKDKTVSLPKIVKNGKRVRLGECDSNFIRRISLRERRLATRVRELEQEIAKLSKSVYENTIF